MSKRPRLIVYLVTRLSIYRDMGTRRQWFSGRPGVGAPPTARCVVVTRFQEPKGRSETGRRVWSGGPACSRGTGWR